MQHILGTKKLGADWDSALREWTTAAVYLDAFSIAAGYGCLERFAPCSHDENPIAGGSSGTAQRRRRVAGPSSSMASQRLIANCSTCDRLYVTCKPSRPTTSGMVPPPVLLTAWAAWACALIERGNRLLASPAVTALQFHGIWLAALLASLWVKAGRARLRELERQRRRSPGRHGASPRPASAAALAAAAAAAAEHEVRLDSALAAAI